MSYTKGELVNDAFNEIGIADYEFDVTASQSVAALRKLDSMMAGWDARGIKLSYPVPSGSNGSNTDEDSNIPDSAWEAVVLNLALRIAPSFGKNVSIQTMANAKFALNTLFSMFAQAPEMQLPSMPRGAGYKEYDYRFTPDPENTLKDGDSAELDLEGVF
jgi:hypothetical protein